MAFTNNMDIREALDRCATEVEWEYFTSSVPIPPELIPYAMARYATLGARGFSYAVSGFG